MLHAQCSGFHGMSHLSRALARAEKNIILPQPYQLFSNALLNPIVSPATPTGFELFSKVADYKTYQANRRVWKELTEEQKHAFEQPGSEISGHCSRIDNGYKVVASSSDAFNPFYEAPLFPWEIIKDKLRHKPPFSSDIYDQLIREALSPQNGPCLPTNLYYSEKVFLAQRDVRPYHELPTRDKERYSEILRKKRDFVTQFRKFRRNKRPATEYDKFVQRCKKEVAHLAIAEQNKVFGEKWRESKSHAHIPSNTRIFRERKLDISTSIVMSYIFDVGSVEGFEGDWRRWKHETTGKLHYFNRAVFPYILQRRNHCVTFVKDYSEYGDSEWSD